MRNEGARRRAESIPLGTALGAGGASVDMPAGCLVDVLEYNPRLNKHLLQDAAHEVAGQFREPHRCLECRSRA
jgi:hypothetical protein